MIHQKENPSVSNPACLIRSYRGILISLAIMCLVIAMSGCASMGKKFKTGKQADVELFANSTIGMLAEAEVGFKKGQMLYIQEYLDPNEEEERVFYDLENKALDYFKKVIGYSLQLVVITEMNKSQNDRVAAYADFVSTFQEKTIEDIGVGKESHAAIVENIRSQEKFMDALMKAQPIINMAAQYMMNLLDELTNALDALAWKLENKIDLEYAEVIRYQEILETQKYSILQGFEKLYLYNSGDTAAYDQLKESGVILDKKLISKASPTYEDMTAISEHLFARMASLQVIENQIAPDWKQYRNTREELTKLHMLSAERVNKARLLTLLWLRAHQKMASGIQSPAEWYNISELPSTLFKGGVGLLF